MKVARSLHVYPYEGYTVVTLAESLSASGPTEVEAWDLLQKHIDELSEYLRKYRQKRFGRDG